MKNKICDKGYSCGKTCISVSRSCRVEFAEGVSVSLENRSVQLGERQVEKEVEKARGRLQERVRSLEKERTRLSIKLSELRRELDDVYRDAKYAAERRHFKQGGAGGKKALEELEGEELGKVKSQTSKLEKTVSDLERLYAKKEAEIKSARKEFRSKEAKIREKQR